MKIHPVEAELFPADGQIDGGTDGQTVTTKLIVAFRSFANEPSNCCYALDLLQTEPLDKNYFYFLNKVIECLHILENVSAAINAFCLCHVIRNAANCELMK